MLTTNNNNIFFDDVAEIENGFGKNYLNVTAENLSPDCNCSNYTDVQEDEEFNTAKSA